MRSIKFNEAELEFLVGQYELELIEAEKYVGEIKNILSRLGGISRDIPQKNELKKKKGRGRPAKTVRPEIKQTAAEKSAETDKKGKGKPGRPKKRGRKKGSKGKIAAAPKVIAAKVAPLKAAEAKQNDKKADRKAKPAKAVVKKTIPPVKDQPKKESKPAPKKVTKPGPKKAPKIKAVGKKTATAKPKVKEVPGVEVKPAAPIVPAVVQAEKTE